MQVEQKSLFVQALVRHSVFLLLIALAVSIAQCGRLAVRLILLGAHGVDHRNVSFERFRSTNKKNDVRFLFLLDVFNCESYQSALQHVVAVQFACTVYQMLHCKILHAHTLLGRPGSSQPVATTRNLLSSSVSLCSRVRGKAFQTRALSLFALQVKSAQCSGEASF